MPPFRGSSAVVIDPSKHPIQVLLSVHSTWCDRQPQQHQNMACWPQAASPAAPSRADSVGSTFRRALARTGSRSGSFDHGSRDRLTGQDLC